MSYTKTELEEEIGKCLRKYLPESDPPGQVAHEPRYQRQRARGAERHEPGDDRQGNQREQIHRRTPRVSRRLDAGQSPGGADLPSAT